MNATNKGSHHNKGIVCAFIADTADGQKGGSMVYKNGIVASF
jgi:hypothetical protein